VLDIVDARCSHEVLDIVDARRSHEVLDIVDARCNHEGNEKLQRTRCLNILPDCTGSHYRIQF